MSQAATFPKSARLLKPSEFSQVFAGAGRYADSLFTVLARARDDRGVRLGLAISKKVAKSAVKRNRLKRIIRESFRIHRSDLRGTDLVVMCRPKAQDETSDRLFAALALHWQAIMRDRPCVSC